MIRILLILGILLLLLTFGYIFDFSMDEIKICFKDHPDSLLILLALLGYLFINLVSKCKRQQEGLEAPETKKNETLEKLQERIVIPQKKSVVTVREIKNKARNRKDAELEEIFKCIEKRKYELVISKIRDKLKTTENEKIEFLCRFTLYYTYLEYENDQYLSDIIDNLQKLIPLVKKYSKEYRLYLEVRYSLMVAYAKQNKFENVKKENYDLLKEMKNNPEFSSDMKYRCYNMQAAVYLEENNIPYAMGYFDKALEYSENDFDILFNMALTYHYMCNDIDKCLEYIDKIDPTQISENDERYRLLVDVQCYCLALKKDYFKAYEIMDNYLNFSNDRSYHIEANKAYIAYKLNKFDEAQKLVDEVLSMVSEATAINVRGMLQLDTSKYEEAYHNFKSIISEFIDGDKYFLGEIYYHCSYACLKLNKVEEAIDYFNKAKETNYNDFNGDYIVDLDVAQQEHSKSKEKKDCSND